MDKPKFKIGENANKDLSLSINNFIQKGTSEFNGNKSEYFMWDISIDGTEHIIFASSALNEMYEIAKASVGSNCTWKFSKTPDKSEHLFNNMNRAQLLAHQLNNAEKSLPNTTPPAKSQASTGDTKGDIMGALKSIEDNVSYIKDKMGAKVAVQKGVSNDDLPF